MNNWFEVKVKYDKIDERGVIKKVTEPYLIDAMSFTEAEARAITELEPYLSGEFLISNIARCNYVDLFPFDDGDKWFKCKLAYVSIDEEKGTEKRKTVYNLVQANDVKHAWDNIALAMLDSVVDYEVNSIQETTIMDIFPYNADGVPSEISEFKSPTVGDKVETVDYSESKKVIVINTPDGQYSLPVLKVAEHRAKEYGFEGDEKKENIAFLMEDDFEAIDWLVNNSNYEDWETETTKLNSDVLVDRDDFWCDTDGFEIKE